LLWKSEASALIDQVSRQQEILRRLSEELSQIRIGQSEALGLVREVHSGEEHLHDELCVMERDLERWSASRKRLAGDIKQQSAVLDRARKFEEQLRGATEEMRSELQGYQKGLEDLRQFADSARVHSVNLSLVKDPAYWEYASRARAFAHDLIRFIGLAESLGQKIQSFLTSHPGGALAAHLSAPNLDEDAFLAISEEQEKISQLLRRWKQNGAAMLSEGERALEILHGTEQAGVVVSQLGETSLLINQQAKGNLERWN